MFMALHCFRRHAVRALVGATLVVSVAPSLGHASETATGGYATARPTRVDMPKLLVSLGRHSEGLTRMTEKGSYRAAIKFEEVDGDGNATSTTETVLERKGGETTIVRSTKDGKDNTEAARAEERERAAKRAKDTKKKKTALPFDPKEQGKYRFSLDAYDSKVPSHVRIHFEPAGPPSEETFVGDAWVDAETGTFLSMSGSYSKRPTFVDQAVMRATFDIPTPDGPMPSTISLEAKGSFLWVFKKRFRMTASASDYRM